MFRPSSMTIEFAVQMTCNKCVEDIKKTLGSTPGIEAVDVNLEKKSVVLTTTKPILEVQKVLEDSGRKVAVRGYGGSSAAVAILEAGNPNIKGVVRMVQPVAKYSVIDGTIDGLTPNNNYQLKIHECGDISQGCNSLGNVFTSESGDKGDLGIVKTDNIGRADFRFEHSLNIGSVIGRSLVLSQQDQRLVCGVIARSAGLFENPKTICACDGVTIWNEKIVPKPAL